MDILFLCKYYFPHVGGVETHVRSLSLSLRKRGYKAIVITERIPGTKAQETIDGVKIFRIRYPKLKFIGLIWIWIWFLLHWKLVSRSDLVHIHDVFIWYLPLRFLFPEKPVYITFHGWEGFYPIPLKFKLIRKLAEKLTWANICVGRFIKKWYGTKPNFVTYGGVVLHKYHTTVRGSYVADAVFVGRLIEDTGLPVYLKALHYLKNKKVKIVFLGDGPLKNEAEKFGKVLGFIENVAPYLQGSRFVFTSGYLSILEAMAARRLVFAVYDNPLKRDYLKMAPFARWVMVESSAKRLAEKIKYFLKHPREEKQLVELAYKWARQQTWKGVTSIYEKLWEP